MGKLGLNTRDWPYLSFIFPPDYTCANGELAVAMVACQNQTLKPCWAYFHGKAMVFSTFIHELGHLIGVGHAGMEKIDGFDPVREVCPCMLAYHVRNLHSTVTGPLRWATASLVPATTPPICIPCSGSSRDW